jgi:hypothetical protein
MVKIDRISTSKYLLGFPEITTPWRLGCGLSAGGYLSPCNRRLGNRRGKIETTVSEAAEQASTRPTDQRADNLSSRCVEGFRGTGVEESTLFQEAEAITSGGV